MYNKTNELPNKVQRVKGKRVTPADVLIDKKFDSAVKKAITGNRKNTK